MGKSSAKPACRLSVCIAREAPVAVILRRGPSKWVRLIRWDMETDTFEPGQWLHGRIPQCDLSPDGRYLAYFADDFRPHRHSEAWIAISRPPYLTALALWKTQAAFGYSPIFLNRRTLLLSGDPPDEGTIPGGWRVTGSEGLFPAEQAQLHRIREGMEGWDIRPNWMRGRGMLVHSWTGTPAQCEVELGQYFLVPTALRSSRPAGERPMPAAEASMIEVSPLAEGSRYYFDHGRRLVYTRYGQLWRATISRGRPKHEQLADFNGMGPESVLPPAWACRWR